MNLLNIELKTNNASEFTLNPDEWFTWLMSQKVNPNEQLHVKYDGIIV